MSKGRSLAKASPQAGVPPVPGVTQVPTGAIQANGANLNQAGEVETLVVTLRHKTGHHTYRRAGLVLTRDAKEFEVTLGQFEILSNDPHVVVVEPVETNAEEVEEK
jgi:hypothetical protein